MIPQIQNSIYIIRLSYKLFNFYYNQSDREKHFAFLNTYQFICYISVHGSVYLLHLSTWISLSVRYRYMDKFICYILVHGSVYLLILGTWISLSVISRYMNQFICCISVHIAVYLLYLGTTIRLSGISRYMDCHTAINLQNMIIGFYTFPNCSRGTMKG